MDLSKYSIKVYGNSDNVEEEHKIKHCPLPLDTIPNIMGINLCNVDRIEWTRRPDNQLVDLSIYFIPEEKGEIVCLN